MGTFALTLDAPPRAQTPQQRLERLYLACRADVYAYAATLLRDRGLAEEVTALAFERAFRRRALFNPWRGSERAWLFGIARNAALDELRRRKRGAGVVAEICADETVDAGAQVERSQQLAAVRTALATLSAREREIVALKFHGGLSNRELARVLGVSESNAGTLLHRTITKLRSACDE
jgi:RNA polymerase sigma factor (sigma-70 family)